jgi:prepilin-type N-terminal cleavage/methylation domain-containing protein
VSRPGLITSRRVGYTLVELLLALAITSMLMAATASMVRLASRAVAPEGHSVRGELQAARVLDGIAAELREAHLVLEASPSGLAFVTPDRDGDGATDHLRYAWSGGPEAPLTRQQNGGQPAVVARHVANFTLDLDVRPEARRSQGGGCAAGRRRCGR